MKLIYIRRIGELWDGKFSYEFIFAKSVEGVDGEGWDDYPASGGNPEPPESGYIDKVGRIETDAFNLTLIQNSDTFAVWDAVDGVVGLAWEDITELETYPENRLKFFYGDDMQSVVDQLYEKDIMIDWKYDSKNELQY